MRGLTALRYSINGRVGTALAPNMVLRLVLENWLHHRRPFRLARTYAPVYTVEGPVTEGVVTAVTTVWLTRW